MSQKLRIGTYNVNNLFDRYDDPYNFSDDPWRRKFAAKPKKLDQLYALGARIRTSDVDVLALQEVESFGALREFFKGHVGPSYKLNGVMSLEGNDPRGIDLGVASKLPLGRVVSHRFRQVGGESVFSRDCLQVEIMSSDRKQVLLTLFICHLKSKYSEYLPGTDDYKDDEKKSLAKRTLQVKETVEIVSESQVIDSDRFVVLGDMNDTPDSTALQGFLASNNRLKLVDVISTIDQSDSSPDSFTRRPRDTHKWEKDPDPDREHPKTTYSQLDYILLSKALAKAFKGSVKVEQRGNTAGSDHCLCWADVELG